MRDYREVVDTAGMEAMLQRIAGFHDSMVKELHMVSRAYLTVEQAICMARSRDLRLLINSQWDLPGVEFLCINVASMRWAGPTDGTNEAAWGGLGTVTQAPGCVDRQEVRLKVDDDLSIVCERLFVAERPDWTGPQSRFAGEVPSPDSIAASDLGAQVWQCSSCAATFAEPLFGDWAYCSGCQQLTCRSQPDVD